MNGPDRSAGGTDRLPGELHRGGRVICAACETTVALEEDPDERYWLVCDCHSVRLPNASEVGVWQPRLGGEGGRESGPR